MARPDLNLLFTLDVLLAEGSVARAARRLKLSPSAMSRSLARLRAATGDPLLVRAGRGLVASPRALELRERVGQIVSDAEQALRPARAPDLRTLERTFTLRTREGFVENFGARLLARVAQDAPGVRLRFLPRTDKESTALRDGMVDLETGVVGKFASPELRTRLLFRDRLIGVVHKGHPLGKGDVTLARFIAARHIRISRRGLDTGPIDDALAARGRQRLVVASVAGFAEALALARATELVACVPQRHTGGSRAGMHGFAIPLALPQMTISLIWHPRMDGDAAHRWLRECVRHACAAP